MSTIDLPTDSKYSRTRMASIALVVFAVAQLSRTLVKIPPYKTAYLALPEIVRWLEQPARWLGICLAGLYVARRIGPIRACRELGLARSPLTGLAFGLVATAPMWLPGLLFGKLANDLSLKNLIFYAGVWPLGEEILFRGYVFRQLHRGAGWNLWLAAAATGLAFGVVHLGNAAVQQMPLGEQFGTVALIGVGGMLYAWVFARWNDDLWVVWALHGFMNLWWNVFDLSDNPLGGVGANAMRVLTVVAAIVLTLWLAANRRRQCGRVFVLSNDSRA